jgi:tocopherol cyclase
MKVMVLSIRFKYIKFGINKQGKCPMSALSRIAGYHGHNKQAPFFEGWYFKLVDRNGQHPLAVIPGLSLTKDPNTSHAFIQVLSGQEGLADQKRFVIADFKAEPDRLDIRLAENHFNNKYLQVDLGCEKITLSGMIHFGPLQPWPCRVYSPGVMGWYHYVPFMECYHGVLSMDHTISGSFVINGRLVDYDHGRGYIEKDWGRSFPDAYLWLQSNGFDSRGTSLMASTAIIPWLGSAFRGHIAGLLLNKKLYRFATYSGAKTEHLEIDDHHIHWLLYDRHHALEILAQRTGILGHLAGPSAGGMSRTIAESLRTELHVALYRQSGRQRTCIYEGVGGSGGLEVYGDIPRLLRMRE